MSLDDLVSRLTLYRSKPIILHGYIFPFILLYAVVAYVWTGVLGFQEYFELGCIVLAFVGILQILTVLFCVWFVRLRCALTCKLENDCARASMVQVIPTPNNGSAELLPLHRKILKDETCMLWFEFQKVRYIYDNEKLTFSAIDFPVSQSFKHYQETKGLESEALISSIQERWGDNKMEMVIPTFLELFKERATAPFFVFQVFCVGLWCMDEYWYYSLFTLCMLVTFEATMVKQQLKYMVEIRNMGNKPYSINVYRNKRWGKCPTDQLLVGDLVAIGRSQNDNLVPCDVLLLRGSCIVDESMLTGESIPQMKESVEDLDPSKTLDLDQDIRLHVLFGGTRVVQHNPPSKTGAGLKSPDNGCLGYVIRTGFKTSQGQLLRTIMFGVKRVTANNLEAFGFILFLLIFAVMAAAYVWTKGIQDESRNRYKLFLECTLILTSVVPPELPIELSLAVNSSLLALQKLGVYCTEPFRIPFAGKINICCFDKTGTLTTDNLVVEGVTGLKGDTTVIPVGEAPAETIQVMVSCHSLVQLEDEMVGDPLEKACLQAAEWVLTKNDAVIPKKGKEIPLKIFQRFHFSSNLKRMSVITGYIPTGTPDVVYLATVKGAPETLKPMFIDPPDTYDAIYQQMTREGARVLALGIKNLGTLSHKEIREFKREEVECKLRFVGFVIVSCPLKSDSKAVVKEIVGSSHQVVMITGDNALTACHVAKELRFTRKGNSLILDHATNGDLVWSSTDGLVSLSLVPEIGARQLIREFDLCLTGQAFAHLSNKEKTFLNKILPHVKVYARMAPKQKEHVITGLKKLGYTTLMCGDGTNDVGALKHAHVGVALLSHPLLDKEKERLKEAAQEIRQHAALEQNSPSSKLAQMAVKKRPARLSKHAKDDVVSHQNSVHHPSNQGSASQKINQMLKQIEDDEKAQIVRLGDASIAAPFTSKYSSIQSICHVIKQGRCTLVTTLQMFKILALNALVLAYSQSVLYLDGVKFSDSQATAQGLLLAACFLFVSRSKPLKTLAKQRPLANIFNVYTLLTVTSQFAVHLVCLYHLVKGAHELSPEAEVKLKEEFKPSILNTTVYLISVMLQLSTFAVNYRGHPFMESLTENKSLLYSLMFSTVCILTLGSGMSPELSTKFELVELPTEVRISFDWRTLCGFCSV